MIDPKRLTEKDEGRRVAYTPGFGPREYGRISSWNENTIWVRYGWGDTAASTRPEDLSFTIGTYQDQGP